MAGGGDAGPRSPRKAAAGGGGALPPPGDVSAGALRGVARDGRGALLDALMRRFGDAGAAADATVSPAAFPLLLAFLSASLLRTEPPLPVRLPRLRVFGRVTRLYSLGGGADASDVLADFAAVAGFDPDAGARRKDVACLVCLLRGREAAALADALGVAPPPPTPLARAVDALGGELLGMSDGMLAVECDMMDDEGVESLAAAARGCSRLCSVFVGFESRLVTARGGRALESLLTDCPALLNVAGIHSIPRKVLRRVERACAARRAARALAALAGAAPVTHLDLRNCQLDDAAAAGVAALLAEGRHPVLRVDVEN
eukprot:gene6787-11606_t